MMNERVKKMQHLFAEVNFSSEVWKSVDSYLAVQQYLEMMNSNFDSEIKLINELDNELCQEMWSIIMTKGTAHQIAVVQLSYAGKTQMEIAEELGCHQTSIQKTLRGNFDYNRYAYYGGLRNKLIKEIRKSQQIKKIMKKMYESDFTSPHYSTFKKTFNSHSDYKEWLHS